MKSVAETLGPPRVKLAVEVPFAELQPYLDAAYKSIGDQVNVPGFRRGKVPSRIIDQRFGRGAVLQEAINDALPDLYSKAVDEARSRLMDRFDDFRRARIGVFVGIELNDLAPARLLAGLISSHLQDGVAIHKR